MIMIMNVEIITISIHNPDSSLTKESSGYT